MHPFVLERPRDLSAALASGAQAGRNDAPAEYIAGGTDMVQLLQEDVRRPERLVSLAGLLDNRIEVGPQGLRIGAAATMAEVAAHPAVVEQFPVISEALLELGEPAGAQPGHDGRQSPAAHAAAPISAMSATPPATSARRAPAAPPSAARTAGMRCSARARTASPPTRPTLRSRWSRSMRPSRCAGRAGSARCRSIEFHRLPGDTPHIETVLEPGEVIAAITVPASPAARRSHYLKVRDRASFEFAVVSAAVALDMDGARIRQARVALGGVGTKPWRVPRVEAALAGASLDPAALRTAAALAAEGAQGRGHNDFKIELMQRAIVRAVETAGARA